MNKRVIYLQDQMYLHSYLYYLLDSPLISDIEFDKRAMELVQLIESGEEVSIEFKDFRGDTGYHLVSLVPERIVSIARQLVRYTMTKFSQ